MSAGPESLPLRTRNDEALRRLEPFLVTPPWHRAHFDRHPLGLPVPDENVFDPTRLEHTWFLDRLATLDRLTFKPLGMPMPRWLFYDAAEVPGGIFGFAHRAERLPSPLAERLDLRPGDGGLMPLSMYIAIPARPPDTWYGHNLASLNRVLPELELRGLGSITKALALKVFRCRRQLGTTQWSSPALHIHARFGPLDLLTAWTPAHADAASLTYAVDLTDEKLRNALGDPEVTLPRPAATLAIRADDVPDLRWLQARLEAGESFRVAGPPAQDAGGSVTVPIAEASPRPAA